MRWSYWRGVTARCAATDMTSILRGRDQGERNVLICWSAARRPRISYVRGDYATDRYLQIPSVPLRIPSASAVAVGMRVTCRAGPDGIHAAAQGRVAAVRSRGVSPRLPRVSELSVAQDSCRNVPAVRRPAADVETQSGRDGTPGRNAGSLIRAPGAVHQVPRTRSPGKGMAGRRGLRSALEAPRY